MKLRIVDLIYLILYQSTIEKFIPKFHGPALHPGPFLNLLFRIKTTNSRT